MKTNVERGAEREPEECDGEAGKESKGGRGGAVCPTASLGAHLKDTKATAREWGWPSAGHKPKLWLDSAK